MTTTLTVLFFAVAVLYSSVGHAGASGYLAAMALLGMAPAEMRPTALVCNVLVSIIATVQFARAGHLRWRLLLPFALGSVPLAFLGGGLTLPPRPFKVCVGAILLLSAIRLAWDSRAAAEGPPPDEGRGPHPAFAVGAGAGIGIVSGLTGTGGGIFLSPLLLFCRWATPHRVAGVSAAFILVNSLAGLAGNLPGLRNLPPGVPLWAATAVLGGTIGSYIGARRLPPRWLRRVLAVCLAVAAVKLILG